MSSFRDMPGNFLNMQLHCGGIDTGKDKAGRRSPVGTDRTVNISVYELPLPDSPRTGSLFGPSARYAALLPDPCFVLKPYIRIGRINTVRKTARSRFGEVF